MSKFVIILIILIILLAAAAIFYIIDLYKKQQINQLKEWLLLVVVQAEKEFGDGTGQLKLRFVYDLFLTKFKWLSNFISFELFSALVDETLEIMRDLLQKNINVQNYVNK